MSFSKNQLQTARTMVVFDWDNTLFPTKARQLILSRASKQLTESEYQELTSLSEWVYRVLRAYISFYSARNICIVTAAKRGWIESSLGSLGGIGQWAQIRKLLFFGDPAQRIEVVYPSAAILPFTKASAVAAYKHEAFQHLTRNGASRPHIQMLVSIGDSYAEYQASKRCAASVEGMCVGRVKLKKHPSLRSMIRQCQCMVDLCETLFPENFDIDMSCA